MRILIIIAQKDFKDEEFQKPFDVFRKNNISVDIASLKKGECTGVRGTKVTANLSFSDVRIKDYDAIMLVGGPGARTLFGNADIERIVKSAEKENILISAICIAPMILAKAGVLSGKKATVWDLDKKQSPVLRQAGAEYIDEDVVVDGKLITANGPSSAERFGKKIVEMLKKNIKK